MARNPDLGVISIEVISKDLDLNEMTQEKMLLMRRRSGTEPQETLAFEGQMGRGAMRESLQDRRTRQ